jgi:hypothetical protein
MGKIIVKNVVERKPGHLYYVDGKGNVCEAKMARGGKKKKKKAVKKKAVKKKTAAKKKTVKKATKKKAAKKKR